MNAPLVLHGFLSEHREEILARCKAIFSSRTAPRTSAKEMPLGIPLFLDQVIDTLRSERESNPEIGATASRRGTELSRGGFTVSQVVRDYGDVCQSITELAHELDAPITASEFHVLNGCLDDATADAVTAFGQQRDQTLSDDGAKRTNQQLGVFSHDLRNQLTKALLAFDILKAGKVGTGGSTAAALGRSLGGLRDLIDRSLADVRLTAGIQHRERVLVAALVEEVEVYAAMEATVRGIGLSVDAVDPSLVLDADPQILASVLTNLLDNAFKFTKPDGQVSLGVRATAERVFIDVADECGGLPPGKIEELFRPFEQRGSDRSGIGLGLAIARRGAEANDGTLGLRDLPGVGCVFTVELPRR